MAARGDTLKFAKACSTEDLKAIFDPAYAEKLNCSLEEHVLRLLVCELLDRGEPMSDSMREAFIGPDRCEHGRSIAGYCGKCDGESEADDESEAEVDRDEARHEERRLSRYDRG